MNAGKYDTAVSLARSAPVAAGRVDYLINRPSEGVHKPVDSLYLDVDNGIEGDRWKETAWLRLPDGSPDPRVQVSLTNTRVMQCFTGTESDAVFRCGDNIYTDLNLTEDHLPVGTLLQIGEAVIEVSDVVNDACGKFAQRFGAEAFQAVRDPANAVLRLRGIFARIRQSGRVQRGDALHILEK